MATLAAPQTIATAAKARQVNRTADGETVLTLTVRRAFDASRIVKEVVGIENVVSDEHKSVTVKLVRT